jgi:hypothetical protein
VRQLTFGKNKNSVTVIIQNITILSERASNEGRMTAMQAQSTVFKSHPIQTKEPKQEFKS